MDYEKLGYKAGLEIHQQIDTHKLFCSCSSTSDDSIDYTFQRYLRPTQSELGDVDKAALAEAKKERKFLYSASRKATCLVEADEEPPHQVNAEAIDVCLTMALLTRAYVVNEIHFMRKIVIDGSNTSGFQRTGLCAINGNLDHVNIQTVALEEDAARKIEEKGNVVHYGLDRLGIPLIEIATGPDLKNPGHTRDVAEKIGLLLQSTGGVKRGLGTIRQDLNVSIAEGSRVEIKGIQSLSSIERVAAIEVERQQMLIASKKSLEQRTKDSSLLKQERMIDVTSMVSQVNSTFCNKLLKSGVAKGMRLPGFAGLLKSGIYRLGREFSGYAKSTSGIGGIIHSDELPGYGITNEQLMQLYQVFSADQTRDAFVVALGKESVVDRALEAVMHRAESTYQGVPAEVRRALPDDTTEYLRPLPGAARMYPETDVQPFRVTEQYLHQLEQNLPERPEDKFKRFITQYDLHEEQTKQLLSSGFEAEFEDLIKQHPTAQSIVIRILLNTIPELQKEHLPVERITKDMLVRVLDALDQNQFSKEGIPSILTYLLNHPSAVIQEAIKVCGFETASVQDIEEFTHKLVIERREFINKRGMGALGPLMGVVMKQFLGKADGALISDILKRELKNALGK